MKTIRIFGQERTSSDGKKFTSYSYVSENTGEFFQVKFTSGCLTQPKQPGYFKISFEVADANIQKKRIKDGFKPNDVLWILKCSNVEKDAEYEQEIKARKLQRLEEALS